MNIRDLENKIIKRENNYNIYWLLRERSRDRSVYDLDYILLIKYL